MESQRSRVLDAIGIGYVGRVLKGLPGVHARVIPLLLALLMVASPLSALTYGPAPSDDPGSGGEVASVPSDRTATFNLPDWNGMTWDWVGMANETGFVRVIVASGGPSETEAGMALSGDGVLAEDRFSVGFDGFSASVRLDSIGSFISSHPDWQVYPDLPVKATVAADIVSIGADQMWSRTDSRSQAVTGIGTTVAVIDTGIYYAHPDLGGDIGPSFKVIGGYDFYNKDSDPVDDNGHGTHVAGTIAAVAPGAKLLAYKALGADGSGSMSDVISAIQRALDPDGNGDRSDHVDVISMSLGGTGSAGDPVSLAVREAVSAGVVVVVAAGNEGPSMGTVASPGIAPEAVTVGALDSAGNIAGFSSRGTNPDTLIKPEISAPGVDINSTVPFSGTAFCSPTGYTILSGTSMATPHVSGAAALLIQLHPDWTPEQVKSALMSGSNRLDESLWVAGAGEVWVPGSADITLFGDGALLSYGNAGSTAVSVTVTNKGGSAAFLVSSHDFSVLSANISLVEPTWANMSVPSKTSISLSSGGSELLSLDVPAPASDTPEGYYEGDLVVGSGGSSLRVPFGYVVLSRVNIHVLDTAGREVIDPFGEVVAYDLPDADVVVSAKSDTKPAPPASFLLPSGTYAVHAVGHELIYTYSDPYVLSGTFTLGRVETKDVYLRMSDARQMVLDLETDNGIPIYAKDYRVYVRHEGVHNVSFHLTGSDYFTVGTELPTLPRSRTVYVSDTSETVGISVAGFSYSPLMWSFMSRNWNHWFESVYGSSSGFYIESSSDLHYLLAWEFKGVDSSSPLSLSVDAGKASVYTTKYDLPGQIMEPWCDWNTRLPQGAESTFYVRRDTQAPINPFFSGMTRTTIVQGVFSELYYPGGLFNGYSEAEYYSADYSHVLHAATASEIYLPDRNYLTPLEGVNQTSRIGSGPYYPSVRTDNTNSSLVLIHPLLRDQSGAKVGGMDVPRMRLYLDGGEVGIYQLSEYRARPDAERVVSLPDHGAYVASIDYQPGLQVTGSVNIELGFTVPRVDIDPPTMTGLAMSQRFVPGEAVPLRFTAVDSSSGMTASVSWRSSDSASWTVVPVTVNGVGDFGATIQTGASDARIDIKVKVTDPSGNYIQYTASKAALAEVPVVFELSALSTNVDYRNSNVTVGLTGQLTDVSGNPLHATAAVPLELMVGATKVGMIMDEHVTSSSRAHDGTIAFDWVLNPYQLFTGPDQDLTVMVMFDLGTYQPVSRSFTLHSVPYFNAPPVITLEFPADGSVVAAGTTVDLSITDTSSLTASYSVDGSAKIGLADPWDISTASWSDGTHALEVWATDEDSVTTHATFDFTIDALSPAISFWTPKNNSHVPLGSMLRLNVSDARLSSVIYQADGSSWTDLASPYQVDMTSWASGTHSVGAKAEDVVGHVSSAFVQFEIMDSTVTVSLVSPSDGAVVRAGAEIVLEVLGSGTISCSYSEGGVSHSLPSPYTISTSGWADGQHVVVVNVTNDIGGWFELSFTIIIDSTPPQIVLVSPTDGSFVSSSTRVTLRFDDPNFELGEWLVMGTHYMTVSQTPIIFLDSVTADGVVPLDVTARDKAGNVANASFTFLVDAHDPVISVTGVSSSGGVALGSKLTVTAADAFMSTLTVALDDGAPGTVQSPAEVETGSMSVGSHTLHSVASDQSGRTAYLNTTFYLDDSPPTVVLMPLDGFVPGSSLDVFANVSDDLGIASVVLYQTMQSGAMHSVQMTREGALYKASLGASYLWDGMSLYANASDSVGHMARSGIVTVRPLASPDRGPSAPAGPDAPAPWSFISSVPTILGLAAVVAVSLISVLLILRRRRPQEVRRDVRPTVAANRPVSTRASVAPPAEAKPPVRAVEKEAAPEVVRMADAPKAAAPASPLRKVREAQARVRLIEAIPETTVKTPVTTSSGPDDAVDYGELIEKELIEGALGRSVFKEDMRFVQVFRELESMALDMDLLSKSAKKELRF